VVRKADLNKNNLQPGLLKRLTAMATSGMWYSHAQEGYHMGEEEQAKEYLALLAEHNKIQDELTGIQAKLKRIGDSLVKVGKDLIEHNIPKLLDEKTFQSDIAELPSMMRRHEDLSVRLVDTKAELAKFGDRFKPRG
jgi:hypothetical protein